MEDAVHIVHGSSAGGTLRVSGSRDAIVLRDSLCQGPCDVDPKRHLRLRRDYWRRRDEEITWVPAADRRRSRASLARDIMGGLELIKALSAHPPDRPVILWTTRAWQDQLTLWWTLHAFAASGAGHERCWVGRPRWPRRGPMEPALDSLGIMTPEHFHEAFGSLEPLTGASLRAGASLWRKYASPSPTDFSQVLARPPRTSPELHGFHAIYGRFFPSTAVPRAGRLLLSPMDKAFLGAFREDRWLRPIDLLLVNDEVMWWLHLLGDGFFPHRLRAWAVHRPSDPALVSRRERKGKADYTALSFRLTARGRRLLDQGFEHAEDFPPLFIGGCQVYRGPGPWARSGRTKSLHLLRWFPKTDPSEGRR